MLPCGLLCCHVAYCVAMWLTVLPCGLLWHRQFSPTVADTFINFLVTVESTQEVYDYIKTYLGESREALSFAKQFLEKRQKSKDTPPQASSSSMVSVVAEGLI